MIPISIGTNSNKGFLLNVIGTFKNFGLALSKLPYLGSQPESACILTAETVDLIFYKQSMLLSIPFALVVGSFTVVIPEAYKKMKCKLS
jgi:hypothetical protein